MEKKREIQSQRKQWFDLMVCKCTILSHEMKKEEDKFTRILLGYFFEYDNGCEKKLSTNEMGLSTFVSHVSVLGFEV
jgi:hypothetical protein